LHLSVLQRTNKSFDARRWCGSRTYEYYLPASVLGLCSPDGSTPEDQDKLALLREVLAAYCGYKPFQNYAGNRSQYVGQKAKGEQNIWHDNGRCALHGLLAHGIAGRGARMTRTINQV
jgi:tRNA U38,U39,U40 pseudouridine synthase TruA